MNAVLTQSSTKEYEDAKEKACQAYRIKDQARYGPRWYQIGDDKDWGIHGYPNFGKWMTSHGCIRIAKDDLAWLAAQAPTSLKIIGKSKYKVKGAINANRSTKS